MLFLNLECLEHLSVLFGNLGVVGVSVIHVAKDPKGLFVPAMLVEITRRFR
jgi:hypothetical protein